MFCSEDSIEIPDVDNFKLGRRKRTFNHIIGNLIDRELNGKALHNLRRYNSNLNSNNTNGPFGKTPPERLRMSIDSTIPKYALEAGNVFMGFTECGRYLLSYTSRPNDLGMWNRNGDLSFIYKLNFWLFTPYKIAKEVYSVVLFENQTILHDNLLIEIVQWPAEDNSRVLITGRSLNPGRSCSNDSLTYVTITTIPDVKPCPDCKYEPPDEGDEDYTEAPRLRKTCLDHGLTIHLAHDQVEPYPLFKPHIQLNYKDSIIFNTGNIFHMFTIVSILPHEDSPFKRELLTPPTQSPKELAKKRHLRCDFWFKKNDSSKPTTTSLTTIMKNCSTVITCNRELNRFIKNAKISAAEEDQHILSITKQTLLLSYLSSTNPNYQEFPKRRLSASSCDSELSSVSGDGQPRQENTDMKPSSTSSLSWSWPKQAESSAASVESDSFGESALLQHKQLTGASRTTKAKMLPPPSRKFFKQMRRVWQKPSFQEANTPNSSSHLLPSSDVTAFDVFEVGMDELPIDRSFTSFRKRKLADKKYEFSDEVDDHLSVSNNSSIPRRRSPRKHYAYANNMISVAVDENSITKNCSSRESSPRREMTSTIQQQLGNASPRLIPSPALSPSYNNPAEILRPITNTPSMLVATPLLLEANKTESKKKLEKEPCTTAQFNSKKPSRSTSGNPNARPTFSSHLNCIAKVLRCYAETDESGDNLSVRTDTDDEYNQTLPFPVALPLNVLGKEHQQMAMLSNSKARFCPTKRIEIIQRSLDIEVLCNEVSTMICLAGGKYFCCCFDYDVAIVDICPDRGIVTALAVVLFAATSLKRFQQERYSSYNYDLPSIPGIPDPRKKYESVFSFEWNPCDERARILYMGNLVELQCIPEYQWNPTKFMVPHITELLNQSTSARMTLRNDLAVTDSQSLYQLKDFDGIITLYRHETLYERLKRQKAEGRNRDRRIVSSAGTSTTSESEQEDDFANLSVNSDSTDSNDHNLSWPSDLPN